MTIPTDAGSFTKQIWECLNYWEGMTLPDRRDYIKEVKQIDDEEIEIRTGKGDLFKIVVSSK